ncbi:MAG: AAA domain-containing protein [Armatimonadetes bacterium]|nr:AAA domain-containing protein [Armatimonadota bacterium]NIM23188.1 AAA domain-containing protein [Armatimonadota bacterium]NIM67056.1 AAA domain-containing protein [Armatimonadota bacterium]NIM75590.1 AAA domain-containing protein [Armatimonadota bacterium]NIN05245.1 AAA domain-containing protein [Armatimonadota bacterium]
MTNAISVKQRGHQIIDEVERVIVGKRQTVELALIGLLCGGHILLEDIPGVGKTMLAKSFARALGGHYRRVQFTPDLLPADITGVSIFNQKTGEFQFRRGPVFANVLLADEINRATPKTQSSLLECMEEFQVTVDGVTYPLEPPFFVIATENPIEFHGTYPLPEAQLDRFLMRLSIGYPKPSEEVNILTRQERQHPIFGLKAVISPEDVGQLQRQVRNVHIDESVKQYLVHIVNATRRSPAVSLGGSPRASIALMRTSQAKAALEGREYVLPDDVKYVADSVLNHRILLTAESRARQLNTSKIVEQILSSVPVPVLEPAASKSAGSTA